MDGRDYRWRRVGAPGRRTGHKPKTPIWWSIGLAAIGILGIYLAGRKNRWGWAVGVFAQLPWIAYALVTQQWGFIASALAYGFIYGWNWVKWERERKAKADVQ